MDILGAVTSIFGGGLTGLIGTAIGSFYTYKTRQLDIDLEKTKAANELAQRKLDADIQAQEWAARTKVAEITTAGEVDKADAAALQASYDTEPKEYSNPTLLSHAQEWVMVGLDALRAIIRPGMTIYLSVLTTLIYVQLRQMIGSSLPVNDNAELLNKLIDTVLYLFTTAVLWYFGSRIHQPTKGK